MSALVKEDDTTALFIIVISCYSFNIMFYSKKYISFSVLMSRNSPPYGHLATKIGYHIAFNQSSSKTVCEAVSELAISPGTAKQGQNKV